MEATGVLNLERQADGELVVSQADDWVQLGQEALTTPDKAGLDFDGEVLTITASNGTWRYRAVATIFEIMERPEETDGPGPQPPPG